MFDFYTLEGATGLAKALREFQGGRLVINVVDMPIKCPVAPLEFAFLADWYFTERGIRDRVRIVYATPLDGAFTKPMCNHHLTHLLGEKRIEMVNEFNFNYEVDPLPGKFPVPVLGPMTLMEESRINHLGKLAFKWVSWNLLLPGRDIPMVGARTSMAGTHAPEPVAALSANPNLERHPHAHHDA
jgi:hypothetical protein